MRVLPKGRYLDNTNLNAKNKQGCIEAGMENSGDLACPKRRHVSRISMIPLITHHHPSPSMQSKRKKQDIDRIMPGTTLCQDQNPTDQEICALICTLVCTLLKYIAKVQSH
jgi:hypothetical protein